MTHANLLIVGMALLGQLGGGRYDSADDANGQSPPAAEEGAASEITIGADAPQPTIASDTASPESTTATDPSGKTGARPDVANPFAAEPPAADASAAAVDGPPPVAAEPESSVLIRDSQPADLMRSLLQTPATEQLPGIMIPLGAAVRDAATRHEQTEQAQAYWDLSAAVAHYYLALQEVAELAVLRQAVAAPSDAWDAAAQDLGRRVEATRQSASAAQWRLHGLMGASAGVSLPLPADAPHCGRYNTRYDELFAGRQNPAARQMNELMPHLHGELVASAGQVAEAGQWLNFVSERRDPATDGTGLLRAYELMALRRRDFVEAAREYNNQIAAYAELAAPNQVGPDRLVAMLIRVSNARGNATASGERAGVQPAAAIEAADQQPATESGGANASVPPRGDGAPRTYAWRPFERFRHRERSIVVKRLLLGRGERDQ